MKPALKNRVRMKPALTKRVLMNRILIISFFIFLIPGISRSQILRGKITNESGDPVPYSTVYVVELKQGTTANTKGDYELKLPPGKHLVSFQSLGYSPVFHDITIGEETITRNVTLPFQFYEIPEVRISASGEDPAYDIMRRAIGMAPYYLNYVSSWKAEVYIRGNIVFRKIPKLVQRSVRMDYGANTPSGTVPVREGDIYMMESYNEVEFTAPDNYLQKVISVNSTFPDQGDNITPMDIIKASFYQPVIADIAISPLSPEAFSYYRFRYLGASLQGELTVFKIQVTPRMKSQQLFEGSIYILEDLWCLHSLNLSNNNIAGKISIEQLYIPVERDMWMPVSLKFDMEVSILGFKADAGYGSSMKYSAVTLNQSLKKPGKDSESAVSTAYTTDDMKDRKISGQQEKIERILEKDELTNRDMVAMARLMNREARGKGADTARKDLEIRDKTTRIIEKDAGRKDSTFWAEIRPVPLSDAEARSIRIRDSIRNTGLKTQEILTDSIAGNQTAKKGSFASVVKRAVSGHTWYGSGGAGFTFGGLAGPANISFNPVDGFVYGLDFRLSGNIRNSGSAYVAPEISYAFSREKLMWRLNGGYSFKTSPSKSIYFRTGMISTDMSTGGSINRFLNTMTSLFLKKNHLRLYESGYFLAGFRDEITNGLKIDLSAEYNNRKIPENNSNYSFLRKSEEYAPNLPVNRYLNEGSGHHYRLDDQIYYGFTAGLSWLPRQRYRINEGIRIPAGSDWPLFSVLWKHGIYRYTDPSEDYRHFDMIRFEASKTHDTGAFSEFMWRIRTGGFINNSQVSFFDFFHFNSQSFAILLNDYQDAFYLPEYYSLSTPEMFGELHLKYTSPYLLLKYLPGISRTLVRENIIFSWLGSRNNSHYTEIGYSLTELFFLGEAGIYAGFDNFRFKNIGFRLILKFG